MAFTDGYKRYKNGIRAQSVARVYSVDSNGPFIDKEGFGELWKEVGLMLGKNVYYEFMMIRD